MRSPFSCHITYTVKCGWCDTIHTESWPVGSFLELPWPTLPTDWRVIDGLAICSNHTVTIKKKSKKAGK